MAKRRGRPLLIVLVLLVALSMACCCGCAGFWHFLPDIFVAAFTEEGPLKAPVVDPDPEVGDRLERAFAAGGPVQVTGEEIVQLVEPWNEEELYAFWVDVRPDDTVDFALSVHFPEIDRFLNVQVQSGFEMERGWFTDFTVEEMKLGTWDLGQYVRGQQLAENANQSMANQRSQDPDVARALDQIDHLWLEDGALWVELAPDGWDELRRMRQ